MSRQPSIATALVLFCGCSELNPLGSAQIDKNEAKDAGEMFNPELDGSVSTNDAHVEDAGDVSPDAQISDAGDASVSVVPNQWTPEQDRGLCYATGWCWLHPAVQGTTLFATASDPTGRIWAAGAAGTILSYEQNRIQRYPIPTHENIHALFFLSASAGWAVGDNGTVLHWDGSSWQPQANPFDIHLRGVWAFSDQEIWAAGWHLGSVRPIHFDGQSWTEVGPQGAICSMLADHQQQLWFIPCFEHGIVQRDQNQHWNTLDFMQRKYFSIAQHQSSIYAPGYPVTGDTGFIDRYEMGAWSFEYQSENPIYALASDNQFLWGVGETRSVRFDGSAWLGQPLETTYFDITASPSGFYAVGNSGAWIRLNPQGGEALTHHGVDKDSAFYRARDIQGLSPNNLWAIINDRVAHWNGQQWDYSDFEATMLAVENTNSVWAVHKIGSNLSWKHFDGQSWSVYPMPSGIDVQQLKVLDETLYGLGDKLWRWDGSQWNVLSDTWTADIALAPDGKLLRSAWTVEKLQGQQWISVLPAEGNGQAILDVSPQGTIYVGFEGSNTIKYLRNDQWNSLTLNKTIQDINAYADTEVFISYHERRPARRKDQQSTSQRLHAGVLIFDGASTSAPEFTSDALITQFWRDSSNQHLYGCGSNGMVLQIK